MFRGPTIDSDTCFPSSLNYGTVVAMSDCSSLLRTVVYLLASLMLAHGIRLNNKDENRKNMNERGSDFWFWYGPFLVIRRQSERNDKGS